MNVFAPQLLTEASESTTESVPSYLRNSISKNEQQE